MEKRPTALELRMGRKAAQQWIANKQAEQTSDCERCGTPLVGPDKNYCPQCQE